MITDDKIKEAENLIEEGIDLISSLCPEYEKDPTVIQCLIAQTLFVQTKILLEIYKELRK